jgi:membrane-bound ClpP family serine protease
MKSQIKDIVIGIFAVIGFTAIVMGFNNPAEPQQVTYATPESHVWEFHLSDVSTYQFGARSQAFAINKVTGEVRKYETEYSHIKKSSFGGWATAIEQ